MCSARISEQTATFALQNIKRLVFITEVESVYSAVRTESLYKTDRFVFKELRSQRKILQLSVDCVALRRNRERRCDRPVLIGW
jgi:hypothetical protein